MRQLAAFHTQGNTATLCTTRKATSTAMPATTARLVHGGVDGSRPAAQERRQLSGGCHSHEPARRVLVHARHRRHRRHNRADDDDGSFGFAIDGEYSDWTVNTGRAPTDCLAAQEADPSVVCGHHLRTWPVKDRRRV